jgi:hypothetical protein
MKQKKKKEKERKEAVILSRCTPACSNLSADPTAILRSQHFSRNLYFIAVLGSLFNLHHNTYLSFMSFILFSPVGPL